MIFSDSDYVVEPANIQVIHCVNTVNIANMPRQIVPPPVGVTSDDYGEVVDFVDSYAMINKEGLQGDIVLEAGYNCDIVFEDTVKVSAVPQEGYKPAEVPVTQEEEDLLAKGQYLSRGLKCHQVVSNINGIYTSAIPLVAGSGISIDSNSEANTVLISLAPISESKGCDLPECVKSLPASKS
ncbi:MAG: hypothetical protein Q4D38_00110 [Planctomycetia bacterium]|nr:hypothetical protein [Planctomycetia bacterium]